MDINTVYLMGRIGDNFKYAKSNEGKEFATFSLEIIPPDGKIERGNITFIRLMVFDPKQVKYLRSVGAHGGCRAMIIGYINSYKNTYKGIETMVNGVIVRDIKIVKTV